MTSKSKVPAVYTRRKKTSKWHWDFLTDKSDDKMFKVYAQFQGKWSKEPVFSDRNHYRGSNPASVAQQAHWGKTMEDRFDESWIAEEQKKDYQPIIDATGLKDPVCWIHVQVPGQMHILHMDNARADNLNLNNQGKPMTLDQRRKKIARLFIMLDDWHPGQVIMLGNYHWTKWKMGDAMWFSWADVPHATANMGHNPRPMLFLQGEITTEFKNMLNSKNKIIIKV